MMRTLSLFCCDTMIHPLVLLSMVRTLLLVLNVQSLYRYN